jgi:hypothetical protein
MRQTVDQHSLPLRGNEELANIIVLLKCGAKTREIETLAYPGGLRGSNPPKFRSFEKAGPNSQFRRI